MAESFCLVIFTKLFIISKEVVQNHVWHLPLNSSIKEKEEKIDVSEKNKAEIRKKNSLLLLKKDPFLALWNAEA